MVKTWESAWLGTDGTRVLYLLPLAWTDRTLPLKLTPAADVLVRVMVGRHDAYVVPVPLQPSSGLGDMSSCPVCSGQAPSAGTGRPGPWRDAESPLALLHENGNLSPSLIKIDVQGAEMLVLQGAASLLKSARPALFVELHEEGLKRFGTSVAAILAHLSDLGYEAYWLTRSGSHAKADTDQIHTKVARIGYVDVLFLKRS